MPDDDLDRILDKYVPADRPQQWGGLRSYLPDKPAWMKTALDYRDRILNAVPEAAYAANFIVPGVKMPPIPPKRIPNPIRAYHGSPHDFEQFDLSKIGTGEGAQAYGHGLYFAEHEPVAQSYKNVLGGREFRVGDKTLYTSSGGASKVLDSQSRGQTIAADALDDAFNAQSSAPAQFASNRLRQQRRLYPEEAQHIDEALKVIGDWQESGGAQKLQGKMYEVALHASPEQFLDWDKPLAGQSAPIKQAFSDVWPKGQPTLHPEHPYPYDQLGIAFGKQKTLDKQAAADALREAGIPGIRYLDQLSRGNRVGPSSPANDIARQWLEKAGGDQQKAIADLDAHLRGSRQDPADNNVMKALQDMRRTSNYVVWSPEIIEILRKYGLIGPATLAAMGAATQDQNQQ